MEAYYDGFVPMINLVLCLGWDFLLDFFFSLKGPRPFKHSVIIGITSSILSANTEEG